MSNVSSPPPSAPLLPAPAASLILLRQAAEMQVLVGRRAPGTRAFPGAIVFPGGKLEAQDRLWPGASGDVLAAARCAALRETFEETGLLITSDGYAPPSEIDIATSRRDVEAGAIDFADLMARPALASAPKRLTPFAHWITPEGAPYRFDTSFFVLEASSHESQAALICAEFEALDWISPRLLLRDQSDRLMTPTRHCLGMIAQCPTPREAVAAAHARGMIDGAAARISMRATGRAEA